MQKLLLVYYHSENRATSQIWKVLPNMVFPPIWGEKMAAFWACACKLSWTLLSPARVQPLYGARRKESSGTGLRLHRSSFLDVSEIFLVASSPFATRLEENSWGKSRLRTRVVGTAEAPFTLIRIEKFENAALFLRLGLPSTLIRHENEAFRKHTLFLPLRFAFQWGPKTFGKLSFLITMM